MPGRGRSIRAVSCAISSFLPINCFISFRPINVLVRNTIFLIREQKVILDRDLATLYGVGTKALKQAVKRNHKRFPEDFMFVMDQQEFEKWRSQNVTSISDRMGLRYPSMAFTEQGVAMLSGLLKSDEPSRLILQSCAHLLSFAGCLRQTTCWGAR